MEPLRGSREFSPQHACVSGHVCVCASRVQLRPRSPTFDLCKFSALGISGLAQGRAAVSLDFWLLIIKIMRYISRTVANLVALVSYPIAVSLRCAAHMRVE